MTEDRPEPPLARLEAGHTLWIRLRENPNAFWLLTALSLLFAVCLFVWSLSSSGTSITVSFEEGHGLKPGDRLRCRGIDVGEVTVVRLHEFSEPRTQPVQAGNEVLKIMVEVELEPSAEFIAREGSLFWIERPQVSLSGSSGLDTVVGAKYIVAIPAPSETARKQFNFVGLERPVAVPGRQEITVQFKRGHGLKVGDSVRSHGLVVGEVTVVNLASENRGIIVRARLGAQADDLARSGTQFWIERPQVGLTTARGLDTILGGRYLSALPALNSAAHQSEFVGLESPPATAERKSGGLEIVLESPNRYGVDIGSPLLYRGIKVGIVTSVQLAPDSRYIETRIFVQRDYRELICENTRFWSESGFGVDVGFSGVELDAESLQTIASGGVGCATPNESGKPVVTGHRFQLVDEGDPAWLDWAPQLATSTALLPDGAQRPQPQTLTLRWKVSRFGLHREHERSGLILFLDDGTIVGPADLFRPYTAIQGITAIEGSVYLDTAGRQFAFDEAKRSESGALTRYDSKSMRGKVPEWPVAQIRVPERAEETVIITPDQPRGLPVPDSRLVQEGQAWKITADWPIPDHWSGSPVLSARDGKLVGILQADYIHFIE